MGMGEVGMKPENHFEEMELLQAFTNSVKRRNAKQAFEQRCELRKEQYEINLSAKVGEEIRCAFCGTDMYKKSWQQKFCCTKCRDKYHNSVDETRRERTVETMKMRGFK